MRVAITGATGFVGNALAHHLGAEANWQVTALTRRPWPAPAPQVRWVVIGDLVGVRWPASAFADMDAVVHAAALLGKEDMARKLLGVAATRHAGHAGADQLDPTGINAPRLGRGGQGIPQGLTLRAVLQARTRSPRPAPATACQISHRSVRSDMSLK